MAKFRRKRYLIKTGLQFRYMGAVLLTILVVSAICTFTTYYNMLSLLGGKLANVYPQGRLIIALKDVNMIVLYRVLLLIPLIMVAALFLSHKIAGPAYRIEKILRDIGGGNFNIHLKLRKGDELTSVADAVNDMTAGLKRGESLRQRSLQEIRDLLRKDPIDRAEIEKRIDIAAQKKI